MPDARAPRHPGRLLRGLAAFAVMLYHFTGGRPRTGLTAFVGEWFVRACRQGWVGVEVFFVLSGL
ncbi:MAG: hypothetical protein R3A52_21995 [Polyangiales bacterium]